MSLLNIGVTGLRTQQTALNIVGQNITNASTPGYTRQRANIESIVGSTGALGGSGVKVSNVERIADAFIDEQVRTDSSLSSELSAFTERVGQLETSLFDTTSGIDAAMRDFFAAIHEAANEPFDVALREFVLSSADGLVSRFRGVSERTWLLVRDTDAALSSSTAQINELAAALVELNDRIAGTSTERGSSAYNALLDQRTNVLKDLSGFVSVSTVEQDDGQINVFIGKGQPLVLGQNQAELNVTEDGELVLKPVGGTQEDIVTGSIQGGELGGLLRFREEIFWPVKNELGRLAASIATAFNEQHALGVDLEGEFGGDFFRDINDPSLVGNRVDYLGGQSASSTGSLNVYIEDPFVAEPDDYVIRFAEENVGSFTVERRSDGEIVFRGTSLVTPQEIEFEGLRVEFASGTFSPGEAILIRPFVDYADQFDLVITDPSSVALASPILVDTREANQGTGEISVHITDGDHPIFADENVLLPPLLIEFVSDTDYRVLDNTDPSRPIPLEPDMGTLSIVPGAENHLLPIAINSSVVTTSGPSVSAFQTSSTFVNDFTPLANGYPASSLSVTYAGSDYPDQTSVVALPAASSAAQIAAELSGLPGVQASAITEVELSNFVNFETGTPVELTINGVTLTDFSDLADLADQVNANTSLAARGIIASSDGSTLSLKATDGRDLSLHFQGDPNESVRLTNSKGEVETLNGSVVGSYSTATIGGTVAVVMEPGLTLSSGIDGLFAANPDHERADLGFDARLIGEVKAGDKFELNFNTDGVADNRNGLAMATLGQAQLVGHPPRTFSGVFGGVVQEVGIRSAQAQINLEAAQSLLTQSETFRESISGVNLDEEAANLIRHEQAYNAAAQVIAIARDIFNVLLNSVG